MPRARSLSARQVAVAALDVVDRDGVGGLSMRAVATRLHVSTMALYRYVSDREELELLLLEEALADLDLTSPGPGPWAERLTTMLVRARDALAAHPAVVPLTMTHRQSSPTLLRWADTVAGILTDAGFREAGRVLALRTVLAFAVGSAQLAQLGPIAGPGTDAMAALPHDRFPHLAATARSAASVSPDAEFHAGVRVLLDGLDLMLARSGPSA